MTKDERNAAAIRVYDGLIEAGMSAPAADKLAQSVLDLPADWPSFARPSTGVFGLWDDSTEMWLCAYGMVIHGPRCVVMAHLRTYNTVNSDIAPGLWQVCEIGEDGQPILEGKQDVFTRRNPSAEWSPKEGA